MDILLCGLYFSKTYEFLKTLMEFGMNMAIPLMELFCVHVGECVVLETKQIHNLALMSSVTLAPVSMLVYVLLWSLALPLTQHT